MAASDWRYSHQDRMGAAMDFLTSGRVSSGFTVFGTEGNETITGCNDSSDCAAGWSCSGGRCRPPSDTGTNAQADYNSDGTRYGSSSASCPTDEKDSNIPPPDTNDCGGGGGGDQTTGGCDKPGCGSIYGSGGNGNTGGQCCGERCCRYFGTGVGLAVQCFCGPCPPPNRCQKWCDSFRKANGRDAEGCSDATNCSECEVCVTAHGGTVAECKPITSGAPCHCGGGNACYQPCASCESDGTCKESCENCQFCITIYNYSCSCGEFTFRCCTGACNQSSGSFAECQQKGCESVCPPDGDGDGGSGDPCAGVCTTRTHCGEDPPPPCPPSSSCTNLGSISAGGTTCYLEKVCDKSGVPDTCKDCDCNCDNDCPDCQLCGADGTCYPDPACDGIQARALLQFYFAGSTYLSYQCSATPPGGCINPSVQNCPTNTTLSDWGRPPFQWVTTKAPSGGNPTKLGYAGCLGGKLQYLSNPDYVDGNFELRDADGKVVFTSLFGAACGCLNCCEDSTPLYAVNSPHVKIIDIEFKPA